MTLAQSIAQFLGGNQTLKKETNELEDFLEIIRAGFPVKSATKIIESSGFPQDEVLKQIGISKANYYRKRKRPSSRLEPNISDRIFRIAYIFARAEKVFGDLDVSMKWLHRPNKSLRDQIPFEMLDTEVGFKEIERILKQIEYGDYD